jgi:hypothetical protein
MMMMMMMTTLAFRSFSGGVTMVEHIARFCAQFCDLVDALFWHV